MVVFRLHRRVATLDSSGAVLHVLCGPNWDHRKISPHKREDKTRITPVEEPNKDHHSLSHIMTTASCYCAYCYKEASSSSSSNSNVKTVFPKCGQCKTRVFCSRDCQKLDWKLGHKIYCGKAGQEGIDFEIREAGDKGYGVFALRDFFKNEKILVERPILQKPYPTPESCAMAALPTNAARERVRQLLPHDGTLYEKAERNDMSCGDNGERGLFLIMSKVNHDCIGNSCHYYLPNRKVKLLVATRSIAKGEEITFCYTGEKATAEQRAWNLRVSYQFACTCPLCVESTSE